MIFGASAQNKALSSAASSPKDTSHRKQNADKYSAKVISNKNTSAKDIPEPKENTKSGGSDKIKGSYEGLMHSSSTVLQQNGRGYDSKSVQKARYNKDFISHNNHNFKFNNTPLNKSYSIMDNYSSSSFRTSSSSMINNIVKRNNTFQ